MSNTQRKQRSRTKKSADERRAAVLDRAKQFDQLPDDAYVREPVVCVLYEISPGTARRWSESGHLPPAEKLGPGVRAYNVGKLRAARKASA